MTQVFRYSMLALVALVMASCVNDDSDLQELIDSNPGKIIPMEIALDDSDLDEGLDIIPSDPDDEAYNDYWENSPWTTNVKVNFTDEGPKVTGTTTRTKATINGGHVTINTTASRVHITLSGSCSDGSVKVYSDYKFKMTFNGLDLTNPNGAAINNQCGKTMYLVLAPGTTNTLRDGKDYIHVPEEDMKGVIFSEGQMTISGSGALSIYSNGRHGISTDDYLRLRKGCKLYINSTSGHGIRGKDGVFIDGSVVNIETSAPGARGITSNSVVKFNGGRTTVITSGNPVIRDTDLATDTTSCAGVKADSTLIINAGRLLVKSTGVGGKGINAHQNLVIAGGSLATVTTGAKEDLASPKGVKCDGTMDVKGGTVYVYSAHTTPVHAHPLVMAPGYTEYTTKPRLFTLSY